MAALFDTSKLANSIRRIHEASDALRGSSAGLFPDAAADAVAQIAGALEEVQDLLDGCEVAPPVDAAP